MRRWIATAIVLVAPGLARADRTIAGSVVDDATGKPVVGALVAVGTAEAPTDDAGKFTIRDAPFGRLDLIIIADGSRPGRGRGGCPRPGAGSRVARHCISIPRRSAISPAPATMRCARCRACPA